MNLPEVTKIIRIDIDPYNLQRDIHENGINEVKLQAETGAVIDCLAKAAAPDTEGISELAECLHRD